MKVNRYGKAEVGAQQQRLKDLKDNLARERELLDEFKKELSHATERRQIARLNRDIKRQKQAIASYEQEYAELQQLTLDSPPFQKFLTAQHISNLPLLIEQLVKKHLTDSRWREVFLVLAELKANDLLLIIEQQIQTYVTPPKLQNLITWAGQITDTSQSDIKPVGKRAIALTNALALALANANALAEAYGLALALDNASAFAEAYALALVLANANVLALANANALEKFIDYAQAIEKLAVYESIDLNNLVNKLTKLQEQIPDENQPTEIHRDFTDKIVQTVIEAFHLTTEMIDLSEQEIAALDNYFYANKFMIDCKEAASEVSQETWDKIEARMLLSKTSWEKLKQQS